MADDTRSGSWVNGIIEVWVPLDVRVDAPPRVKTDAVSDLMETINRALDNAGLCDYVLAGKHEVAEDD